MGEILQNKIQVYEFPDTGDEEDARLAKRIKVCWLLFYVLFCTMGQYIDMEWRWGE